MPLLALNNISKRFGGHQALDDVSLTVEPGEVVAIIGRSGSGKSTLLRCINGLERPDSGTIRFDGRIVELIPRRLKALRCEVGIVFQSYNLFPHLSVERNITLGPTAAKGMSPVAARELAFRVLRMVDLEDKIAAYPQQLSGGQQQRVAIARALINNPKLILADEPTGNLDEVNEAAVLNLLRDLNEAGHTILVVTHSQAIGSLADRRIELEHGRLARISTPSLAKD